jgi:hypothetical protein
MIAAHDETERRVERLTDHGFRAKRKLNQQK